MAYLTPQQALELAMDHHRAGRHELAENLYRQLYQVQPDNPDVVHLLGLLAAHRQEREEGRKLIERSIAMNPNLARYHGNLGTLLLEDRDYDGALASYQEALRLDPEFTSAHYNIGLVHFRQRRFPESIAAYREALKRDPNFPSCELNLGTSLAACGKIDEAIEVYLEALRKRPADAPIVTNLGNLYKEKGQMDLAIEAYGRALALDPTDAPTHNNLGVAYKDQGQIGPAVAAFRRSVELQPGSVEVRSNLIFTLYYDPRCTPALLAEEERLWNEYHVAPLRAQHAPHTNDRSPERRLRIGYVSADLRDHVVGRALLPVFERHDRAQFDPVCYSLCPGDEITERFKAQAGQWHDVLNWTDEEFAQQIRDDGIDILVDLALHTSDNRLGVFARKPAPVQVSWLGYPGTSGLETMDYRITDPYLEPPGGEAAPSREQPFRLPRIWSCYEPAAAPEVNELPALTNGFVTFGSLNNFCKINDEVLALWARILLAVERSRLVLLTKSGAHRARTVEFMRQRGLEPERLVFLDHHAIAEGYGHEHYLRRYHGIDVALDTFPYNGMTTTFDALWMGVPVISLAGRFSLSRAGLSLLTNIGLPELAAESPDGYVQCAVDLAGDMARLAALRGELRAKMQASPLLDAEGLTRHVEAAFRTMWRRWCEGTQG